jgi:hypothetical protein
MKLRNGKEIISEKKELKNTVNEKVSVKYFKNDKKLKSEITEICDILFVIFKNKMAKFYGAKPTYEIDYDINNRELNNRHINNMFYVVNLYFNSIQYEEQIEKQRDLIKTNKKYRSIDLNLITQKLRHFYAIGICFYYFHMVVIESMYEDCLTWSPLKIKTDETSKIHDDVDLIIYAINLYNDITIKDNYIFSQMRRFIMNL